MQSKKINELGTNLSPSIYDLTVLGDAATGQLKKITLNQIASLFGSVGGVSSVAMTVPTGLTVTGSPITTSGTLAVTLTSGYSIPTTAKQTEWDTAFTDKYKWDGGASGLVASTGRTSLGATSVGTSLFTLTNPSAITFLRVNADNSVSTLDAATFRTAIGAGTSSTTGTVTSVAALTIGTTGTDVSSSVANGTTTPAITLNIPTASATNRGALSSADWTTFNSKQNAIALTANRAVSSNSSGALVASITTATELAYLNGVSSNIQTQLDSKAGTFTLGSVSSSPTNVMTITGSGAPVNGSLTFTINQSSSTANGYLSSTDWTTFNNKGNRIVGSPNQAVTTGSSSQYVASITTATELSYLSGVSSNVQTQLDGKAASFTLGSVSSSPSGVLSITGSGGVVGGSLTFTMAQASATSSGYLSSSDWIAFQNSSSGSYLPLSGGTLSGNLIINGSSNLPLKITATEPVVEIRANGSTNVAILAMYPSTGYDAAIGNFNGGTLNLMADSTAIAKVFKGSGFSRLQVGQGADSGGAISVYGSNSEAGYEGMLVNLNSDGNTHFYHRNNNSTFGDIGYFSTSGMYITYYGSYSDIRLKDVIETNPDINLDGIDVIKYTLKSNPSLIRYGYSAQQVQSVLPDLVTLNKKIGGTDEEATLMLNYNDLYVLKIAALEKRILELENKLK